MLLPVPLFILSKKWYYYSGRYMVNRGVFRGGGAVKGAPPQRFFWGGVPPPEFSESEAKEHGHSPQ